MKWKKHMTQMRWFCAFGLAAMSAGFTLGLEAQSGDPATLDQ
jgi:hypothetical protein